MCPTVTSSPTRVALRPPVAWTTVLSWIEVRAPITIGATSPRNSAPNQIEDSAPTCTSPITAAVTATKTFGKWEIGPVGYYSTDLNAPIAGYLKQSQFALGGLIGYNFGPVILQAYLTTDVYEQNYGGHDTRLWGRVIVPLGNPFATASTDGASYPTKAPLMRKN